MTTTTVKSISSLVFVRLQQVTLVFILLFALIAASYAEPTGGEVAAGSASITNPDALTTLIHQTSDSAVINWQDFSSAANELIKFIQPGTNSATLNRVISGNPSSLLGRLEANGKVYLKNLAN